MTNIRKMLHHIREEQPDVWLLPFCALMLVLMVFFAGLYAYSHLSSLEYESAFADLSDTLVPKREIKLAKNMDDLISDKLSDVVKMTVTARYIRFELSTPSLFDSGNAELKPYILPLFEKMSEHLKGMDNTIIVEGHTDNVPISTSLYHSNWELSAARSFNVINYFIKQNIAPSRLVAHGYGEFRPLASNDMEDGRAKNRRIEITILRGT